MALGNSCHPAKQTVLVGETRLSHAGAGIWFVPVWIEGPGVRWLC